MNGEIRTFNEKYESAHKAICDLLAITITEALFEAESKIWHSHPLWFLDGNPIVGYSRQKAGIRLMFWSGADFGVDELNILGPKFKDASIFYTNVDEVNVEKLEDWLKTSRTLQWDYKNIVKRKGQLERIL